VRNPSGPLADSARIAIERLYFEQAQKENTTDAYEAFVVRNPSGPLADSARIAIERLYFEQAQKENTTDAYKSFLKRFPDGSHADECRMHLKEPCEQARQSLFQLQRASQTESRYWMAAANCGQTGDFAGARHKFSDALACNPSSFLARRGIALCDDIDHGVHAPEAAKALFSGMSSFADWQEQTQSLEGKDLMSLGLETAFALLFAESALNRADSLLNQALRTDPNWFDAYFFLGTVWMARDKPDQAIPFYEQALKLLPALETYCSLGNARLEMKHYDVALDCFERAQELRGKR